MSRDVIPIALLAAVGTVVVIGSVYVYQQSRQPSAVTIENLQHSARMTEQRREKMQEMPATKADAKAPDTSATQEAKPAADTSESSPTQM